MKGSPKDQVMDSYKDSYEDIFLSLKFLFDKIFETSAENFVYQ